MEPDQQIAFLKHLLECYSPTLSEASAVAFLAAWMRDRGFAVQIDEAGSVIGSIGSGRKEILLLGHIDTVPGEVPVRIEGGRLYGRGAVDAKGPLACFAIAASLSKARPGWKVTVVGAVGEEGDSRGAKLVRKKMHPDLCIIGEPSSWENITLGYKGSAWYTFSVRRPLAHTAGQAESACEAAIAFWNHTQQSIREYNADHQKAFEQISSSLRGMASSEDGFSQEARMIFNLRLPPGMNVETASQFVQKHSGDADLICTDGIECYRAEKNTALVRAFLSAIRQEKGNPAFLVKTGTSDMNIVGPAWNIPILAYGPGDSTLDHTPSENVPLDEFFKGVRVLSRVLEILQE